MQNERRNVKHSAKSASMRSNYSEDLYNSYLHLDSPSMGYIADVGRSILQQGVREEPVKIELQEVTPQSIAQKEYRLFSDLEDVPSQYYNEQQQQQQPLSLEI